MLALQFAKDDNNPIGGSGFRPTDYKEQVVCPASIWLSFGAQAY